MADSIEDPKLAQPSRPPRNIVICCDGTGNDFGACNSNVVRLYTALSVDKDQVAYYHPGVGTMGAPTAKTGPGQKWSMLLGLAFGAGFRDNVLDAYRYLMETFVDGDRVFLFGFSRGAYTARALAGLLYGYGLLCRGNEGHLPYAWADYKRQLHHINRQNDAHPHAQRQNAIASADQFKATFSHRHFSIHFVGLWDTVASIGWINNPLELLNTAQNPCMKIGRHAMSIDERRCFYQDNPWGEPLPHQDILQVWFAGVHSDVGGSYPNSESFLSNETLGWLLTEAEAAGLHLDEERKQIVLGRSPKRHHPLWELYHPTPLSDCKLLPHDELKTHPAWWLLEVLPHKYFDKSGKRQSRRIPLGSHRQIPKGSYVHPSVLDRKKYGYNPANLDTHALTLIQQPQLGENPKVKGLYRYEASPQPAHAVARNLAPAAAIIGAAGLLLGGVALLLRS